MQNDFTWIVDDQILACRYPGSGFSLETLANLGITTVINLDEMPHSPADLTAQGIHEIHLPVPDFSAPSRELIEEAVRIIEDARLHERPIAVHCRGGLGRTGTVLAAWFVHSGLTADEAIQRVRNLRPHSIETASQEAAVHGYAEYVRE